MSDRQKLARYDLIDALEIARGYLADRFIDPEGIFAGDYSDDDRAEMESKHDRLGLLQQHYMAEVDPEHYGAKR